MEVVEHILTDGSKVYDVVQDDVIIWNAPSRYAAYALVEIAETIMDCGSDYEIRALFKAVEREIA